VVREYIGGGILGEIAARTDAERRRRREAERATWRAEKERIEAADAELAGLCRLTDLLIEAALTDAGYDKHKGEWRRKRAERDARQAAARRGEA
jgi:cob(I)alamin adenosyltransferase